MFGKFRDTGSSEEEFLMKTKLKTPILFVIMCALVGCGGRPRHTVIENGRLVVYQVVTNSDTRLGKYEVWVRDNSTVGWRLVTDQEFQVGDELQIVKKPK